MYHSENVYKRAAVAATKHSFERRNSRSLSVQLQRKVEALERCAIQGESCGTDARGAGQGVSLRIHYDQTLSFCDLSTSYAGRSCATCNNPSL